MKRQEAAETEMEEKAFAVNHVLLNPTHIVLTRFNPDGHLIHTCDSCPWWDSGIHVEDVDG